MLKSRGLARGAGRRLVPVLACLTPEEVVKLAHAAGRDGVGFHVGEHQACPLDDAHKAALGLLHLVWGAPEDEHGFRGPVDEFLRLPQHTEYTGVGHHAEGGLVAHVRRVARGGRVVHADCALCPLNLGAQLGAQQVTGAGDNHTLVAPGGQRLGGARKVSADTTTLNQALCSVHSGLQEAKIIMPILKTEKLRPVHSALNTYLQEAG